MGLKSAQDEALEQLDIVKRENKNLADEIKDLLDQLGDGGRSIHDLDKQRRRLEQEKEELQAALEEAEGALEQEENKVLRSQLELSQVRQEIDRRVAEKEEEFNNTRKNHQRAMESLGASLETEQRSKAEALRIKKKLEGDINELEIGLDHANKANAEGLKAIKRYQGQLRETSRPMRMRPASVLRLLRLLALLTARLLPSLERLRRARPFLTHLRDPSASLIWKLLMPEMLATKCRPSMAEKCLPSALLKATSTLFRLRLMLCLELPRMLKRNPRRPWLMLLVLLMNSVPSRIMLLVRLLPRSLLKPNSETLNAACLMLRLPL